ncbi:amino acid ABC transporter permease [Pusillimonas minor]|uniref:ABC transporter permease subunit n=1 Tax=Pusillimonas minor TaxID=2697024 RepID=A0A842HR29_9BURK|nr:ABC transporter permease subunit [Pusillimonas minor]MBC2770112.1 ABC transporter permease subunit [Pusillimonas minor]
MAVSSFRFNTLKGFVSWHNARFRALVYQVLLVAGLVSACAYLVVTTLNNLEARNVATGFGFLHREAGFAISESLLAYRPADTYARAILVGLVNTLKVAAVGAVLATVLGLLVGLARLAVNPLLSWLARTYIEAMRNVPLLLQLFFWYALITEAAPGPRQAIAVLPGVFLSNRGLVLPAFDFDTLSLGMPVLQGFNFAGGITVSPEFLALLLGLVLYTSAFVAEIVRSGIQAVGKGQWAAGRALGLSDRQVLRLVVLPQALRIMVPPMTSQYLNLTKNSSLAVAIGYPDIVSIVNTTINQTGQAIEGVLIIMAAYLSVSLSISVLMNMYNRRLARVAGR